MQSKKRKGKRINRTPEEVAKDFWLSFYQKTNEILQNRKDEDISPREKKHYQLYLDQKRSLPDDAPIGGLKHLVLDYYFLVKPYVPWDEIKSTLKGFRIADDAIQHLVFILKPTAIEYRMLADENEVSKLFEEPAASIVAECNKKIQELALLVGKLENLYEQDDYYKQFWPLNLTIERIKYELAVNRAIIRIKHENDKKYLGIYSIDKDLKKSPQKHKY